MLPVISFYRSFLLSLVFFAGCLSGDSGLPKTGEVTGKVTVGGAPASKLTVTFESEGGQAAFGTTDENGLYELISVGGVKGAELGANTVRIETTLEAPAPAGYKDPIPPKFNSESTLKVTVEAGENTHNFDL